MILDTPHEDPKHGVDGFGLEDMEWDPRTGIAHFYYSHPKKLEEQYCMRRQPAKPSHEGWNPGAVQGVYGLRP